MTLGLTLDSAPRDAAQVIEALAGKLGLVLVVLGAMHFANLFAFTTMRRRSQQPVRPPAAPPPTAPPPGWQAVPR